MKITQRFNLSLFILSLFFLSVTAFAAKDVSINKHNWRKHPQIVEIRKIVEQIDAIDSKQLKTKTRAFCYVQPDWNQYTLVRNKAGKVQKYVRVGGSDDSMVTQTHYYDADGHLRFVDEKFGRVHQGKSENRLYFDEAGNLLWQTAKAKTADYSTNPSEDFAFNPTKDFRHAKHGRKELRSAADAEKVCKSKK